MNGMVLPPRNGLSLCAGGGGLDMGLELAEPGFAASCYVEWEDYPRQTLIAAQQAGYLHPAPIWDDVKTFDARPWRGIDTIIGGYPCQGESQAGKRLGLDDPRWLWPHFERIIEELGPGLRWCFFENVAGHITSGLETVLRSLRGLGFTPAVGLFSAEETGAPHERQRVFIVAYREGGDGRGEQPEGGARRWRAGFAGSGSEMADADGGNPGTERQQRGGEQRFHPAGGGIGREDVDDAGHTQRWPVHASRHNNHGANAGRAQADRRTGKSGQDVGYAPSLGRGEGRAEPKLRGGRDATASAGGELDNAAGARCDGAGIGAGADGEGRECLSGAGCSELADACQPGLEGRKQPGSSGQWNRSQAHGPASEFCRPRLHPPGPSDMDAWRDVLEVAPDLAPAISLRDVKRAADCFAQMVAAGQLAETEAQSRLCLLASSMANRSRILRLLGNGVHPLTAAYAWQTLSAAHGLGSIKFREAS